MRGFVGGLAAGVVVSGLGVAALSVLNPKQIRPDVADTAPVVAPRAAQGERPQTPQGTDADLVETVPTVPDGQDTGEDLAALDQADLAPAEKPDVGGVSAPLSAPRDARVPELQSSLPRTEPVVPVGSAVPDAAADGTPQGADSSADAPEFGAAPPQAGTVPQVGATADPVPLPETVADAVGTEQAPDPVGGPTVDMDDVGGSPPPAAEATEDAAPLADGTAEAPASAADPVPDLVTEPAADTVTETGTDTGTESGPAPEVASDVEPAPEPKAAPIVSQLPQAGGEASADEIAEVRPGIGTPVVPLTDRFVPPAEEGVRVETPASDTIPAIVAYAEPFDDAGDRPLMSILLMDDPDSVGAEALAEFPYPISFAIDPSDPQAADKMARHRAAGFEVVMMANFPPAATPQDAETAFEVWTGIVPQTVAILEGTGTAFQGNRALSDQITEIALAEGRGLILHSNGLNTAQKLAARAGVPAWVVFRDFDGAGQTPTVMRRFLDQAAFRAGQEGGVIMLGRVRPDTISALILWGLQDRAQRVALAPVSAVLTQEAETE